MRNFFSGMFVVIVAAAAVAFVCFRISDSDAYMRFVVRTACDEVTRQVQVESRVAADLTTRRAAVTTATIPPVKTREALASLFFSGTEKLSGETLNQDQRDLMSLLWEAKRHMQPFGAADPVENALSVDEWTDAVSFVIHGWSMPPRRLSEMSTKLKGLNSVWRDLEDAQRHPVKKAAADVVGSLFGRPTTGPATK